eukprot:XP_001699233.1 predicted protein [Chlamydomonas reinhardtii]
MVFKLGSKKKKPSDAPATSSNGSSVAAAAVEEEIAYHADADENGGMLCTNDELLKQQREAIMQWVKSMGKRLLTGNVNLINTPFPVNIFEPRSYLEKLADVWVHPRYLTAAAQATDPVERMKLVTTWFIAGLHHAFTNWRKPFNPILGETWQAALSDGTSMFMEQISHHPPVSAFHMEGPGGSYRFRGLSQPTVSIQVKYYGFKTVAKGFRYVEFRDGTRIELHYPQYYIKNVVYGSSRPRAEVDGQAILVDVRNKLKTVISFGALKGARSKVLRRVDAVHGFIYDCRHNQSGDGAGLGPSSSSGLPKLDGSAHGGGKAQSGGSFFSMSALNSMGKLLRISQTPSPSNIDPTPSDKEGVAVAAIEGSWLSHINIDGARYWSITKEVPDAWRPVPDPLPSDSRYRQDLVVLAAGDMKGAQAAKEALENRQRNDKKLREVALASNSRGGYRH